jgi:hypothetical protein
MSRFAASYTIYGSGDIVVNSSFTPGSNSLPEIPEVGMLLTLPEGFENVTWYGRGPIENYCDRKLGADVGVYNSTVDDFFIPYSEAQETGNRTDVRWVSLTNDNGTGILAIGLPSMEINALHYSPWDLENTKHPYELTRRNDIFLRLNYKQMGVGGDNSWGAKPHDAFLIQPNQEYRFSYRLTPISGDKPAAMELYQQSFTTTTSVQNVALNKASTADSEEVSKGNTAEKGNDGDDSSRWCAADGATGHWWQVDLGQEYDIAGTEIIFESENNYRYKLETSKNNIAWTVAVDQTNTSSTSRIRQDQFVAGARYLRITYTGLPYGAWASHYELKVFGTTTDPLF